MQGGLANAGLVAAFAAVATSTFAYLYGCGCDKVACRGLGAYDISWLQLTVWSDVSWQSLRVFMGTIYGNVFALFSAYAVIVCQRGEGFPHVFPITRPLALCRSLPLLWNGTLTSSRSQFARPTRQRQG